MSTLEVASSRIRRRGSASSARANAISWRCPIESAAPRSATGRLVALGERLDEVVGADRAGGRLHVLEARVGAAERDVLADRGGEQEALLRHDAELAAQRAHLHVAQVVAVDADRALAGVVEARQQLDERRLARARVPDERDGLPGGDRRGRCRAAPRRPRRSGSARPRARRRPRWAAAAGRPARRSAPARVSMTSKILSSAALAARNVLKSCESAWIGSKKFDRKSMNANSVPIVIASSK